MTAELHEPVAHTRPPALDSHHLAALQMVVRGEIGAFGPSAALRHRTDDLSVLVISALCTLRRDGFIGFTPNGPNPRDGWLTAELTSTGSRLLDIWLRRHQRTPDETVRSKEWFLLLRCAQRGDLAVTPADQLVERGRPLGGNLTARLRELVSAGHLEVGKARLRDCRLVTLSDSGRRLQHTLDLTQPVG